MRGWWNAGQWGLYMQDKAARPLNADENMRGMGDAYGYKRQETKKKAMEKFPATRRNSELKAPSSARNFREWMEKLTSSNDKKEHGFVSGIKRGSIHES